MTALHLDSGRVVTLRHAQRAQQVTPGGSGMRAPITGGLADHDAGAVVDEERRADHAVSTSSLQPAACDSRHIRLYREAENLAADLTLRTARCHVSGVQRLAAS